MTADPPSAAPPPAQRSWPRRLLNRLEVDQAVFFAIAARGWQFLAGPVTVILIGTYFPGEVQGFYYTFWSLIGLQTVFDFSFQQVIVNVASHEWGVVERSAAASEAGRSAASRLSSLLRGSLLWYAVAAVIFFFAVGSGGQWFFAAAPSADVLRWQAPWWTLVALTAVNFWTTPCIAVLEGCGAVRSVYRLHLARAVCGNAVVWALIPLGFALWVPVGAAAVRLLCEAVWIFGIHGRFFLATVRKPMHGRIDWLVEVWPFQWRVGIKGILGFLNTFLITPVVFHYHGEIAAGRLGMTWQILTSVQAACMSWIKTRTAKFGMLVSRRQFAELDRIYFRLLAITGLFVVLGAGGFFALVVLLNAGGYRFADSLLPPVPTALLAVAVIVLVIPESQWTYIHAHKRSPHLLLAILGAALSGLLIWGLGRAFAATGVAVAYLTVTALVYLPLWSWVWWQCRRRWHFDSGHSDAEHRDAGHSGTM